MRWSQTFIPTLREDPADAEAVSHRLMVRAGLVRQLTAGVYVYLPLGQRVIDKVNVLRATLMAMQEAVSQLDPAPDLVLVDGNRPIPGPGAPQRLVVDGDATSACIAAASVIAKVMRDRIMLELDQLFPAYGFAAHKGYGTRRHLKALQEHGPCEVHRHSFGPVQRCERAQLALRLVELIPLPE